MPHGLLSSLGNPIRHGLAKHGLWLSTRLAVESCLTRSIHVQYKVSRRESPSQEKSHANILRPTPRQRIAYVDYVGDVLRRHGRSDLVPATRAHKQDLSVANPRKNATNATARRTLSQTDATTHQSKLSVRRILATYLEHRLTKEKAPSDGSTFELAQESWSGHLDTGFELTSLDKDYLASHGYTLRDVEAWADFTTARHAGEAMQRLMQHESAIKSTPFPLPVLLYFTRRHHIPRGPLRDYVQHLRHALSQTAGPEHRQNTVMMAFARLVRHARRVAPEQMCDISDLLLENLHSHTELGVKLLSERTFMLNRAMTLLSLTTSLRPYQSSALQQEAVAKILRYMTEHEPQLHISREGYRAVVRIQLRLPKTESERQWASLKALSWPPWKQDRTAMDSEIGPEHGVSKAGQSLQRMSEAGYAPGILDKVAKTYSGWSDDGTPTIQTRHALPTQSKESAIWAARIATTRTIQEAWACWLAYEALPDVHWHTDVVLAILQKLQQNDSQHSESLQGRHSSHIHVLPGDAKESFPPPASIHLHTYTRTEPPSTYDFFMLLKDKSLRLEMPVAACLVANARRLQHAYEYLQHLDQWYPGASNLLSNSDAAEVKSLPSLLVASVAEVLCRFPETPLYSVVDEAVWPPETGLTGKVFRDHHTSDQHCLIRAAWLLSQLRMPRSSQWRHIFHSLTFHERRLRHLTTLSTLFTDTGGLYHNQEPDVRRSIASDIKAVVSYRFAQKLESFMRTDLALSLDLESFARACIITARCGNACESRVRTIESEDHDVQALYHETGLLEEMKLIRAERPAKWLTNLFNNIAGWSSRAHRDYATTLAPDVTFEPALLHSWLRALGSFGEYEAMLQVVRTACVPGAVIVESPSDTRSLRKSITALRFYLEYNGNASGTAPAPQSLIDEVKDQVQERFELWASDEEVEEYGRGNVRTAV
ncbi:hypothetical protein AMS68_005885 [Peltaster fructicola]|uniref:Uncharacterized protein n=1 Tax=Peltaster fructicola TaxID=286661 RepID=A0A6H0Y0J9_9PEZI|nr:hypothetical protein AMS68_005885 [Peltaster fructicola]